MILGLQPLHRPLTLGLASTEPYPNDLVDSRSPHPARMFSEPLPDRDPQGPTAHVPPGPHPDAGTRVFAVQLAEYTCWGAVWRLRGPPSTRALLSSHDLCCLTGISEAIAFPQAFTAAFKTHPRAPFSDVLFKE